jgi:hypothetical protein
MICITRLRTIPNEPAASTIAPHHYPDNDEQGTWDADASRVPDVFLLLPTPGMTNKERTRDVNLAKFFIYFFFALLIIYD